MKSNEIFAELQCAGWHVAKDPLPLQENRVTEYAYRRMEGASECVCNDKSPSLCIHLFEIEIQGKIHTSAEFQVCGESGVGWIKFNVYGVSYDDVVPNAAKYEAALRAAWESVAVKKVAI